MAINVMTWVWDNSAASGTDLLVLLAIADNAHKDGSGAWPTVGSLAQRARISERTIQRCIQRLVEMGELTVKYNGGPDGQNAYTVTMGGDNLSPRQDVTPDTGVTGGVTQLRHRGGDTAMSPEPSKNHQEPTTDARPKASELFERFWSVYPRRVSKRGAFLEFERALKRADPSVIISGAERYRDDPNRVQEFTKHPTTWLHQDCWNDDPLPARSQPRRPEDQARERIRERQMNPLSAAL